MKFLIAYNNDTLDEAGGHFSFCGEEMELEMEEHGFESIVLTPPLLTNVHLLHSLSECHICFIANHGDARSIAGNDGDFVSVDTDNALFSGKLLYAVSCTCAKELKDKLVIDGLRSFWGYNNKLSVWYGYPQYARCCMAGIKSLMNGKTVREAKEVMIAQYNNDIFELEEQFPNMLFLAAALLDNREALVVYGEDDLRLSDLE